MSLSERINQIVDRLEAGGGSFRFDALVDLSAVRGRACKHQLVVTLLAILELAKLRVIRVLQDDAVRDVLHRPAGGRVAGRRPPGAVDFRGGSRAGFERQSPRRRWPAWHPSEPLVDDSPTEEVRIDELTGGPTEELPLDEAPTEEVPLVPLVPHEGLGAETVRIDPVPVEKVTPGAGDAGGPDDDDEHESDDDGADEANPGDKR